MLEEPTHAPGRSRCRERQPVTAGRPPFRLTTSRRWPACQPDRCGHGERRTGIAAPAWPCSPVSSAEESFSGMPGSLTHSCRLSVVEFLLKRNPLLLWKRNAGQAPLLHGNYPASPLLWACPTAAAAVCAGYGFPASLAPFRPPEQDCGAALPDALRVLSSRALPSHPGRLGGCLRSLLLRQWQASPHSEGWPHANGVTRPKRVHLR